MSSLHRLCTLLLIAACGLLALPAVSGAATRGELTQLTGPLGCYGWSGASEDGPATCTIVRNVHKASDIAISPDGRNAYVSQYQSSPGIDVFTRDPATGVLTQLPGALGCITVDGKSHTDPVGACTDGRASYAGEGKGLAVSPDGKFVYGPAYDSINGVGTSNGIAVYARDAATGALSQLPGTAGCYTQDGSSEDGPGTCTTTPVVNGSVSSLMVSPDGKFLYSPYSNGDRLLAFSRDTTTGAITPLPGAAACLDSFGAAGCTPARQVGYTGSLSISADGRHAYTARYSTDGVAILDRDPATGVLTQPAGTAGCISDDGSSNAGPNTCQDVHGIYGAFDTQLSADGRTLWVMGYSDNSIASFRVDPATGGLTQLPGTQGCVSSDGSDSSNGAGACVDGRAMRDSYGLSLSPDGRTLYAAQSVGLTAFGVDQATGALTQLPGTSGCATNDGKGNGVAEAAPGTCADVRGLDSLYTVLASPDGGHVYSVSYSSDGLVTAFRAQSAPSCAAATATTPFQRAVSVTMTCTDPNGDTVTRHIVGAPAHGTLSAVSGDKVTYTPAAGYSGADSFTFAADDGAGDGNAATAAITVQPDTTPPSVTLVGGSRPLKITSRGVRVKVHVDEAVTTVTAKITLSRKAAKKAKMAASSKVTIASATVGAFPAGDITITMKPTKKAKKALKALRGKALRRFAPALEVGAKDASGNLGRLLRHAVHAGR